MLKLAGILLKNIPRKAGYFFFMSAGFIVSLFPSSRRLTVDCNLKTITGRRDIALMRSRVYMNYARYYFELFRDKKELLSLTDYASFEDSRRQMETMLQKYGGLILVSLHYNNWDLAGAFLSSLFPGRVNVVVEELSEKAFEWFTSTRGAWGMKVLKSTDLKGMLKALKNGNILVLLGDRDLEKNGHTINMFGRMAHIPSGPAKLALMAKVPVVFSTLERVNEKSFEFRASPITIINEPPMDRTEDNALLITKWLVKKYEEQIRSGPELWCMLQYIWCEEKQLGGLEAQQLGKKQGR